VPDAGRVIAGSAAGLRLHAPGPGTRPLADRVKQALFAILEPDLPGARVLDLFAGSGAAGIEALSRGAALVMFVENDAGAVKAIEENLRRTRLGPSRIERSDVLAFLAATGETFEVAIVDPPYAETELLGRVLEAIGGVVTPGGRVVAKHFWRDRPPARVGLLASERERRFGETTLTFYRRDPAEEGEVA
jgi:16S rRNA (guanine(966)-N(2))-methyltransferase RsmD